MYYVPSSSAHLIVEPPRSCSHQPTLLTLLRRRTGYRVLSSFSRTLPATGLPTYLNPPVCQPTTPPTPVHPALGASKAHTYYPLPTTHYPPNYASSAYQSLNSARPLFESRHAPSVQLVRELVLAPGRVSNDGNLASVILRQPPCK
jgi:hypothetical protein